MTNEQEQMFAMMKAFFEENVPYAKHSGIELLEIAEGRGTAKLPDWRETQNHMGTQHAGALFTLAEAASGAASVFLIADKLMTVRAAITEATIQYKKAARGEILATGELQKPGAEIMAALDNNGQVNFVVDVTLTNSDQVEVASMAVLWSLKTMTPAA